MIAWGGAREDRVGVEAAAGRRFILAIVLLVVAITSPVLAVIDSVSPPNATLAQGSSIGVAVTVEPKGSSSQLVAVGVPAGVTVGFAPNPVSAPTTVTMTVSVGSGASPGSYTITIRELSEGAPADEHGWGLTVTAAATTTTTEATTTTTAPPTTTVTETTTSPTTGIVETTTTAAITETSTPSTTVAETTTTPLEGSSPATTPPGSTVVEEGTNLPASTVPPASDEGGTPLLPVLIATALIGGGLIIGWLIMRRRRCMSRYRAAVDLLFSELVIEPPAEVLVSGPVPPGSTIREQLSVTEPVELGVPDDVLEGFVFFIDDQPMYRFEHDVRYAWADPKTGRVAFASASNPMTVFPGDGSEPRPFRRKCQGRRNGVPIFAGDGEFGIPPMPYPEPLTPRRVPPSRWRSRPRPHGAPPCHNSKIAMLMNLGGMEGDSSEQTQEVDVHFLARWLHMHDPGWDIHRFTQARYFKRALIRRDPRWSVFHGTVDWFRGRRVGKSIALSPQPVLDTLRRFVHELNSRPQEKGCCHEFFLYFVGHGYTDNRRQAIEAFEKHGLLMFDPLDAKGGRRKQLEYSWILSELNKLHNNIKVTVFVDACHAGYILDVLRFMRRQNPMLLRHVCGLTIITTCDTANGTWRPRVPRRFSGRKRGATTKRTTYPDKSGTEVFTGQKPFKRAGRWLHPRRRWVSTPYESLFGRPLMRRARFRAKWGIKERYRAMKTTHVDERPLALHEPHDTSWCSLDTTSRLPPVPVMVIGDLLKDLPHKKDPHEGEWIEKEL